MRWNDGRVTARLTVAAAVLLGGFLALAIVVLLWRSASSAHAASESRFANAKTELASARDQLDSLQHSYSASEAALSDARAELSEWQAKFDTKVKSEVKGRVSEAKGHWIDVGYDRGQKNGYRTGRKDGITAGKSAGYDEGYADGLFDASFGGGGGGGGDDGGNCNPNYSGCLKAGASDYDCAGGSGDGPYYTGTVEVVGYDEYDLDRDGDGVGCD